MKLKYSISKKVLLTFLAIVIGITLTSFISTLGVANSLLKNTSVEYTYRLIQQVEATITDYQNNMHNIGEAILENEYIKEYVLNSNYENIQGCRKILDFAANTRDDVTNIFLIKKDPESIKIISNDSSKKINHWANFEKTEWYRAIFLEKKENFITSSYVQNLLEGQYNWVISQAIGIFDENGEAIGALLIDLNYSSIQNIISDVLPEQQGYVYLLANNGEIVYHPNQQLIFNGVKKEDISEVISKGESYFQKDHLIYVVVDSKDSKWKTVAAIDSKDIYRNTMINTILFSIIAFIFMILSFIASYLFSNWFTKPIKVLIQRMQEVQRGNLNARVEIKNQDEIGQLAENFNTMTKRIQFLLDKIYIEQEEKREYELNALRAQINPHFLYNTLDSIIWMSECNKNEEVVEMTSALSKMLRASISYKKNNITLQLEIQNAMNYLKIQKFRYQNKLDYEIDVPYRLYIKKAAHLVLQPIIENSIYHGIKGKKEGGKIVIRAYEEGEDLFIEVEDNGIGMSEDVVEKLLNGESDSRRGIGISNVNRRIRLIFGSNYGLKIKSKVGEGTLTTIKMPSIDVTQERSTGYNYDYFKE